MRGLLHRLSGHDLTVIEGIDESTALVILSEIGTDLSRLLTVKHFVSWLGLWPQHQGSAGGQPRGPGVAAGGPGLPGASCYVP